MKIYIDGSGGARTGWVYEDWLLNGTKPDITSSGESNRGYPQVDPAVYREMVRLFHQDGVPVGTHAVGDRAMDRVVDTYALVEQEHPHIGLRHSIIHANLPTPHALEVMVNLQKKYDAGYPEMQPGFLWWIGDIYAASYGPNRGLHLEPFKTLQSRGILWSGGSDYFVTPVAARYGLWASTARQTATGTYGPHPFGMTEAVDIHTALRSYTAWASRQFHGNQNRNARGKQESRHCDLGSRPLRSSYRPDQRAEMPDDVGRWGNRVQFPEFSRNHICSLT